MNIQPQMNIDKLLENEKVITLNNFIKFSTKSMYIMNYWYADYDSKGSELGLFENFKEIENIFEEDRIDVLEITINIKKGNIKVYYLQTDRKDITIEYFNLSTIQLLEFRNLIKKNENKIGELNII